MTGRVAQGQGHESETQRKSDLVPGNVNRANHGGDGDNEEVVENIATNDRSQSNIIVPPELGDNRRRQLGS